MRLESRNGVIQTQYVLHLASNWSVDSRLTVDTLCEFQRPAVNQVYRCAGYLRDADATIRGVDHQPPPYSELPRLVEQMCRYVHENWNAPPVHLASYAMWRVNWIHPFLGGNGRTARAASYLLLCARLGYVLPGTKTIPEWIIENREPYFRALQQSDRAWREGRLDLALMEELLSDLLARQLLEIHQKATGSEQ